MAFTIAGNLTSTEYNLISEIILTEVHIINTSVTYFTANVYHYHYEGLTFLLAAAVRKVYIAKPSYSIISVYCQMNTTDMRRSFRRLKESMP